MDSKIDEKINRIDLSDLMKVETLDDLIGQDKIKPTIQTMINSNSYSSIILYGPPASGKTSIGNIISKNAKRDIKMMNANFVTKKEIMDTFKHAPIIIFMDEIHRLDKVKQELFLPVIESGDVILIGATTESPYHELTPALRSRCLILKTEKLTNENLKCFTDRITERVAEHNTVLQFTDECKEYFSQLESTRKIINIVKLVHNAYPKTTRLTMQKVNEFIVEKDFMGDKQKEFHYMMKAAYQKSIRGSDLNASLYYLTQMIKSGDIESIIRRMRVITYEDIGIANPNVWCCIESAISSALAIGFPEAYYPLASATSLLALSPKNNMVGKAKSITFDLPQYNAPSHIASECPPNYKYPHDYPNHFVKQQYMPDELKDTEIVSCEDVPDTFKETQKILNEFLKD